MYRDAARPTSERVEDLLERMTLPEKLAQLGAVWGAELLAPAGDGTGPVSFSADAARERVPDGIGQVTRLAGSGELTPAQVTRAHDELQRWLVEHTRLGIPALCHEEALAGFCGRGAVQLPQPIALAATWDAELLDAVGEHTATELRAVGARQALAPVLDVARDPRWGRVEETYGEDPVLAGVLGTAFVRGLQGHLHDGVLATAKHFAGHGASEGGRNHGPVQLGPRELREVHAEPFAAAIRDAGLASVMSSYASVDGIPPTASRELLTDLLRDELGFTGTVVADYFAVDLLVTHHRVAPNRVVAAARALLAGVDVELPVLAGYAELAELVTEGVVPEEVVDLSVRRVLRQKFELGLFESPYVGDEAVAVAFGSSAGRELARRAATESLVLLTNDGVVPVDGSGLGRVAVVGPTADDPRLLLGDYHYPAHLEATTEGDLSHLMPEVVTPLEGVRRALEGTGCEVVHARGCPVVGDDGGELPAAVEAAAGADLAVVCLGGRSGLTAEATVGEMRDAVDLRLTGAQLELLRAVHATGTRTIAVVVSGRVHTLAEVEAHSDAVLLAWVPGQEGGGAVADVLFGRVAPSGRLPVSLPRHVGQLPVHHGHRAGGDRSQFLGDYVDSPVAPLHPFGHGLTTTRFSYGEPQVVAGSTSEPTTVGVVVTNEGPRDGVEVVQCYVRDEVATVARPDRVLVGFARAPMRVGEQKVVTFRIDPSRLAFFDESMDLVCEPGAFTVELGGCAGDPAVRATFDLDGPVTGHRQREVVPTEVTVT